MATKKLSMEPRIVLSSPAKRKLAGILAGTQSAEQKKSLEKSRGIYAMYQQKWLKKK